MKINLKDPSEDLTLNRGNDSVNVLESIKELEADSETATEEEIREIVTNYK